MVVWDNMSNLSNNYGRAYEYIFLNIMSNEISKVRKVEIEKIIVIILQKVHGRVLINRCKVFCLKVL